MAFLLLPLPLLSVLAGTRFLRQATILHITAQGTSDPINHCFLGTIKAGPHPVHFSCGQRPAKEMGVWVSRVRFWQVRQWESL